MHLSGTAAEESSKIAVLSSQVLDMVSEVPSPHRPTVSPKHSGNYPVNLPIKVNKQSGDLLKQATLSQS